MFQFREGDIVKYKIEITQSHIWNTKYVFDNFKKFSYLFKEKFKVTKVVDTPSYLGATLAFLDKNKLYKESVFDLTLLNNVMDEIENFVVPVNLLVRLEGITCISKWRKIVREDYKNE